MDWPVSLTAALGDFAVAASVTLMTISSVPESPVRDEGVAGSNPATPTSYPVDFERGFKSGR
jgi:hypothetical protein